MPSHVAEGLNAFAMEQSDADNSVLYTGQHSGHERAQHVLATQLSNVETQVPLPELLVELKKEDERDDDNYIIIDN